MSTRILVIDDDASVRMLLRDALTEDGYGVVLATDGTRAQQSVLADPPDLILLDLHMPGVSGWAFHEWMQTHHARIPVVFMTAGAQARQEAERHHADAYLAKPFDLATLSTTVERFVLPRAA